VVVCLEKGADCLHMVQLMRLSAQKPHCLLRHLNPDWFYLSGTGVVVTWKCIQCLEFSLGIAEKSSKCRNFCTHTHDRVTALARDYLGEPSRREHSPTHTHEEEEEGCAQTTRSIVWELIPFMLL